MSHNTSLPSPSLEDSFFPFPYTHRTNLLESQEGTKGGDNSALLEKDLILAAELGQALLERNEELGVQLDQRAKELEALQQEKHVLQQRLEMRVLEARQREQELTSDISVLKGQLDLQHNQIRDRWRTESDQLTELASHNQKLVQQLAEAISVEQTLRSELHCLRDEMDDSNIGRSIIIARLESLQAENKVLEERLINTRARLKSTQEDSERLRAERQGLRERLTELQINLHEKETELEREHTAGFQLRSLNQGTVSGEGANLGNLPCFPVSLQSEIQQFQAKEVILAHSDVLLEREREIQKLREELQSRDRELQSLRDELQPFRSSPGKPSYCTIEAEVVAMRQERDSLNLQLLNTIKHKVALSQEVDAWQEDMRLVICQQVQIQQQEREGKSIQGPTQTSPTLMGEGERGKKGFFSSLFGGE